MTGRPVDPRARLELDEGTPWRGPLRWIALGCFVTFLVGLAMFFIVSRKKIGDPEFVDAGSETPAVRANQGQ